ncbi:MAG: DUF5678 domain-containing protein [Chloroflexi bacterium]|nr:DUF5678 domain-containing protein [Chloroflexota bacterium]MCI0648026.1 DUF5678 domain-containing protein [Chloroflexota bacterium]MCI0729283.1 DUF5678 domain-containing protein [Chloroflexota bacterium]
MSTATLTIDRETSLGLQQMAEAMGVSSSELAERAIRRFFRQEAEQKIEREEAHYRSQQTQLLELYEGRYIAMHEGEVVDTDADEVVLYLRVRQKYPSVGILIKKVTPELETVWQARSPRMENNG